MCSLAIVPLVNMFQMDRPSGLASSSSSLLYLTTILVSLWLWYIHCTCEQWSHQQVRYTLYKSLPICWREYAISCSFTIDGNCNRLLREPVDQCNTGGVNGKQVCWILYNLIFIRWSFHCREGTKLIFAASGAQTLDPTAAISNVWSLCLQVVWHSIVSG